MTVSLTWRKAKAPAPSQVLLAHFITLEYGDEVSYEAMAVVLREAEARYGCVYRKSAKAMHDYANILRREQNLPKYMKGIRSLRGFGYAVCYPDQQLDEADKHQIKGIQQFVFAERDNSAASRAAMPSAVQRRADRSLETIRNSRQVLEEERFRAQEAEDLLRRTGYL